MKGVMKYYYSAKNLWWFTLRTEIFVIFNDLDNVISLFKKTRDGNNMTLENGKQSQNLFKSYLNETKNEDINQESGKVHCTIFKRITKYITLLLNLLMIIL